MMKIYNCNNLLQKLDKEFLEFLKENNAEIYEVLIQLRGSPKLSKDTYSEFIIGAASYLEDFIAIKFGIERENDTLRFASNSQNIVFEARRKFVERYAIRHYNPDNISLDILEDVSQLLTSYIGKITQENIATNCLKWLKDKDKYRCEIDVVAQYCSMMVKSNSSLALFDIPRKIYIENHIRQYRISQLAARVKVGFDFRDSESSISLSQAHANYCLYCHKQNKDSCSTGLKLKDQPELKEDGCPLDQKISEMNLLRSQGYNIAALAIIAIDNPLVALTGHRICNDCSKACIFQKQTPVNIPLVETNILESVLSLPYGVEIYYLLTQWNPLKLESYLPSANTNRSIVVAGLGPAGIAASYYFCRQGHRVFAIDGLKILDCPVDVNEPIKSWFNINGKLSYRISQGFGGVAEYGITNRWNKNFLLLVRIILERNSNFDYQGSVRLGSNINVHDVFEYGFDHIALCLGAGKPKYLNDSGYFLKGVKSSADFLMQLQQTAAYHEQSISSLQIRLPAYVYGGGLTAIDSAVELLNYYPSMVQNFAKKYDIKVRKSLSDEELAIADEYLQHAKIFAQCNSDKELIEAIKLLGGVSVVYRRTLQESPAYARNHEEIEHAIAAGVEFIENRSISKVISNKFGSIESIELSSGEVQAAGTLLLGLGTKQSDFTDIAESFDSDHDFFKSSNQKISYFGDCNPAYHGSVVRAIASVKDGYKLVTRALLMQNEQGLKYEALKRDLSSIVIENNRLSDKYRKLTISAPLAVNNYRVGQFFRLQNMSDEINSIMEPLSLSPYQINRATGKISFLVKNVGKSSSIASAIKLGEKVALMGPAGTPIDDSYFTKQQSDVMILSQDIGAAIAMPFIKMLLDKGCKIYLIIDIENDLRDILEMDYLANSMANLEVFEVSHNQSIGSFLEMMKLRKMLANIKQIFSYGSSVFEQQMQEYITKYFQPDTQAISMLNIPMQCLMKGICGQCIQKVNDDRGYIFACDRNMQDTKDIDFDVVRQRHKANSLLEKL